MVKTWRESYECLQLEKKGRTEARSMPGEGKAYISNQHRTPFLLLPFCLLPLSNPIQPNPNQLMLLKVERGGHRPPPPPPPHNIMIIFASQLSPAETAQRTNNPNDDDDDDNNNMKRIKKLCIQGSIDYHPEGIPSTDFGGIFTTKALAVISPSTTDDISAAVKDATRSRSLTIAARGNGHSTHGQAMAAGGIILDMGSTLRPTEVIRVEGDGTAYADAGGGTLWRDVLRSCVLESRVAPRSWTDYLGLTVGGTLSNAGISGQCFRYGPQTSNVAELEVVTGRGDVVVCSENKNSNLFFSVLGGLGQFGVITRARILLHPAPDMVRWSRMVYSEFENFSRDAEFLICRGEKNEGCLDYVEGFAFVVGDGDGESSSVPLHPDQMFESLHFPLGVGSVAYCLEVALNYWEDDDPSEIAKVMEGMIGGLSYCKGLRFEADVSYVEFLLRVEGEEEANTSLSRAHPWLNLLVSRRDMVEFERVVLKPMLKVGGVGGPVLVYPLLRSKWDDRASTVVPEEEVFYLVALLRCCERGEKAAMMLGENEKVVALCKERGMDFKVYIPHYQREEDWRVHFGEKWEGFVEKKTIFDPDAVLAPGQNVFPRRHSSFSDDVLLRSKT